MPTSILGAKIIVVHPKQHLEYKSHAELVHELYSDGCKMLVSIGRYLINKIDSYKAQNREEA